MGLRSLYLLLLASCGLLAMESATPSAPAIAPAPVAFTAELWVPLDPEMEDLTPMERLEEAFERFSSNFWPSAPCPFFPYTNKGTEPLTFTLAEEFLENTIDQVLVFSFQKMGWLDVRGDHDFTLLPGEAVILAARSTVGRPLAPKIFRVAKGALSPKFMCIEFEPLKGEGATRTWLAAPTAREIARFRLGRSARADHACPKVPPTELRGREGWPEVRREAAERLPSGDSGVDAPG